MQAIERRVLSHAVAAAMVHGNAEGSVYVAEAAAWTADAYASAAAEGLVPLRTVHEQVPFLLELGASDAEVAFVQLVAAEIDALVVASRAASPGASVTAIVKRAFRWTESPRFAAGLACELELVNAGDLDERDRSQAIEIYRISMLRGFRSKADAYRAWGEWIGAPRSRYARRWKRHHARANALAFAGLDVCARAEVIVRFEMLR